MKRKRVIEISLLIAIAAAIVLTLAPAVARIQRTSNEAMCQSNMQRIAQALDLYLADYHNTYPTNRRYLPDHSVTGIVSKVDIAPIDSNIGSYDLPQTRFQYGVNWVEAIYPYMINAAQKTGRSWRALFACPRVVRVYPPGTTTSLVSYSFNFTLAEQPRSIVRNTSNLMMLREMDTRCFNAMLRPVNDSTGNSNYRPAGVFLTSDRDPFYTTYSNPNQHAQGSYITFADGHVQWFSTAYYTPDSQIIAAKCWDAQTLQWYNYGPGAQGTVPDEMIKSIAITP